MRLYKYINCTVDKLLALVLVTNYITKYSLIIITTTTAIIIIIIIIIMIIIIMIIIIIFCYWWFVIVVSPPNRKSRVVAPDVIALWRFHIIRLG